jgi:tetratricopeptide (TPR) repeat protein
MLSAKHSPLHFQDSISKSIVICFLLFVCTSAFAADPVAKIISINGNVEIRKNVTSNWLAAETNQSLFAGDEIRTGADSKTALLMADETLLQINRNSKLQLKEVAQTSGWIKLRGLIKTGLSKAKSIYNLESGEIWLRNKNTEIHLDVNTPVVSAGIRGTEVNLKINPDQSVNIVVLEGMIEAWNPFGNLNVSEGEEVYTKPGAAPEKRLLIQTKNSVQWVLSVPTIFNVENLASIKSEIPELDFYINNIVEQLDNNNSDSAAQLLTEAKINYSDTSQYQLLDAYIDFDNARYIQAQSKLEKLLSSEQSTNVSQLLAITSIVLGDNEEALESAIKAISLSPSSATSYLILSLAYQSLFKIDKALEAAKKALELDGDNINALVQLAKLQFGSDHLIDARETISKARTISPLDSDSLALSGFIALAERNLVDAEELFRRSLREKPDNADAYLGLSLTHMRQGLIAEAMEEITAAVLLDPQRSLMLSYWGKMLHQIERFNKALDVLHRAKQLDPNDPTPELYRAIILRDLNRPIESIAALNRATALNHYRGVYRSNFLLDRDLAVKNVNLSDLYVQLGLDSWAQKKAIDAVKQDYTNSNAHIFYAGSVFEEEDRSYVFQSEQLLARLLQPANLNSFNSFNDYTSMFEEPGVEGNASITYGSQKTLDGDLIAYGYLPDNNFAWQAGLLHEESDGWRRSNFEKINSIAANAKWEPTVKDGVMFTASHTTLKQGDESFPRFEFDTPADVEEQSRSKVSRLELGYHHNFAPQSDTLLYGAFINFDGTLSDHITFNAPFTVPSTPVVAVLAPNTGDLLENIEFKNRQYQFQFQHMQKIKQHQFILGTAQYWGDRNATNIATTNVKTAAGATITIAGVLPHIVGTNNNLHINAQSYYINDIWQATDNLSIEAALYYDTMRNANAVVGTSWKVNDINPRIGVVWSPTKSDTFRAAAFRYLLPFINGRTDPTEIAGIPIIRNTQEGAINFETDLVWEHEWDRGLFSANFFFLNKLLSDKTISSNNVVARERRGKLRGIDLNYNQILGNIFGLNSQLKVQSVRDQSLPDYNRHDYEFNIGLNFVKSNGWSGELKQTFRYVDFKNSRNDEHIPITDLKVEYEFAKKTGQLELEFNNIFNERYNWVTDPFSITGRIPEREVFGKVTFNF